MIRKVFTFYGINLLTTLMLAMLFGGVLGHIDGNEMILWMFITMGVQLAPFITTLIFRKIYKVKSSYSLSISGYTLLSILLPIALIAASALTLSLLKIQYCQISYTGIVLAVAIVTSVIGSCAEEIGWRGCLLDIFETECTPLGSSLFVGLLWGLWHFFKIGSMGITGYMLFVPTIVIFSVLMSYIFHKSHRSIVNMILFHLSINLSSLFLLFDRECKTFYFILLILELVTLGLVFLKDREYLDSSFNILRLKS